MGADKILIIDDEPMVRHMIARILDRAGYQTVSAANGSQGLACFRRDHPALVITDIIMPEREGIGTIRQILRERPGTPIIAISGGTITGAADFLAMARELGATEALRKPFEPADLLDHVTRCLAARPLAERA
ncbi:MAG TPA: response regulator [Stellaceae bacterium]|jgi:DNA-binding NtrC family response regulator